MTFICKRCNKPVKNYTIEYDYKKQGNRITIYCHRVEYHYFIPDGMTKQEILEKLNINWRINFNEN